MAGSRFASLVFLALSSVASAQEVRGVVRKVDPEKKELLIDVRIRGLRRAPMAFDLARDTTVQIGREAGDLASIQPGDRATVIYEDRDGRHVATSISTLGLRAAAAPARSRDEDVITGTLAHVDSKDRSLVIMSPDTEGGNSEVRLSVSQTAKVLRDQKPIALEDLKEGERLTVRAEKRDDKLLAFEVQAGKAALPAGAADSRIERLRRILKAADQALERRSDGPPAPPPPDRPPR